MTHSALTDTTAFKALLAHHHQAQQWHMRELFAMDPQRFNKMSVRGAGLLLDYAKHRTTADTLSLLFDLARERQVEQMRDAMFAGDKINSTENRAVLHTALRVPRGSMQLVIDGQDIGHDVHDVLDRMTAFANKVRDGQWLGYTGKPMTDIVNIGIGGSHLGPQMVCTALREFAHPRLRMHFLSNVDAHDMQDILAQVNPETTLFIVASKSFTTQETMLNAHSIRSWFLQHAGEQGLAKHFVALSTYAQGVTEFGIDTDNMFPFWDWVGGRYSIWSAIGLPVMLSVGPTHFRDFLDGAHAMDEHFRTAPLEKNMPVILAMLGVWNRNFFSSESFSIAPYHNDLRFFPAYLQQLAMESNGKRVTKDGTRAAFATCPFIWGEVGTNGQHSFFQMLHQGTDITPIDFIGILRPSHDWDSHHKVLLANCFAQSEAMMRGRQHDEVRADLVAQGLPEEDIAALLPHKTFDGNRPSNTILMDALTPATLGALIALYEHKTFVQGVIWGINSFDQWGVQLGKVLAQAIQSELNGETQPAAHDCSTNALIALAKASLG